MALGNMYEVNKMTKSRNEKILGNILGEENILEEPKSRIENLLMQLLEALENSDIHLVANSDNNGNVALSLEQGDSSEA